MIAFIQDSWNENILEMENSGYQRLKEGGCGKKDPCGKTVVHLGDGGHMNLPMW